MGNHLKNQRIGFFGGTFDPIHFGHLNLAIELAEKRQLDEVWFCPALKSPHKLSEETVSFTHRYRMVELAIQGFPGARVLDLESRRQGPSYTFDTLQELKKKEKYCDFFLLLGEDSLASFARWYRPLDILALASPLVGARSGATKIKKVDAPQQILCAFEEGWTTTALLDINATEIRKRLKQGLYCKHLLPKEVLDYIKAHRLYFLSNNE